MFKKKTEVLIALNNGIVAQITESIRLGIKLSLLSSAKESSPGFDKQIMSFDIITQGPMISEEINQVRFAVKVLVSPDTSAGHTGTAYGSEELGAVRKAERLEVWQDARQRDKSWQPQETCGHLAWAYWDVERVIMAFSEQWIHT